MAVADQAQRLRDLVLSDLSGTGERPAPGPALAPLPDDRPAVAAAQPTAHVARASTDSPAQGRSPRRAHVIAVASGKGGVGKTNVAVNLAVVLAGLGRRVALVDVDMGLANADVLCGVKAPFNLTHLLASPRRKLREIAVDGPGGFKLIPGANGVGEMADLPEALIDRLIARLSLLESQCDFVILDAAAGINSAVLAFAGTADTVLVVTTPEPTAITDAYGLVKSILRRSPLANLYILVNQVEREIQGKEVHQRLALVARRFLQREVGFAGSIPSDRCVGAAVRRRVPFCLDAPGSRASLAMQQLGAALVRRTQTASADAAGSSGGGFFARLVGRLKRPVSPDR